MLQTLRLERFRNFSAVTFDFSNTTAIYGPNGAGKTSLLEAVRLLSVGKSFRTSNAVEIVQFNEINTHVEAVINAKNKKIQCELFYGKQFSENNEIERQLLANGKSVATLDFLGQFPTVIFLPTDLEIVLGSPELRRRYIDGVLFQVDRTFRFNHIELQRVLRERSALLFLLKIGRAGLAELRPWDELLTRLTIFVRQKRKEYITFINEYFTQKKVTALKLPFTATYNISVSEPEAVRDQEIKQAQNLFGPHRDEIHFELNKRLARRFASRGQARLFVAVLKAAETNYLEQKLSAPTVMLDDLFSELDATHSKQVLELFSPNDQLILTTTNKNLIPLDWDSISLSKNGSNA